MKKPNKTPSSDYVPNNNYLESDYRDTTSKHHLSKYEFDLYNEEWNVVHEPLRVKRVTLPNKGENWKVYQGTKLLQTIEGVKLSLKEREFIRTVEGVNFVLRHFKEGWTNLQTFKAGLKAAMK